MQSTSLTVRGNAEKGLSQHIVGIFLNLCMGSSVVWSPQTKTSKKTECCFFTVKCKTYSIDKKETSIMILKSFIYKVISTDMLVYLNIIFNIIIQTNMPIKFITLHVSHT